MSAPRYTQKTKITRSEYLQLVGLLTLAKENNKRQADIIAAVIAITGETDDMGHGNDAVYSDYSADELLGKLKISVVANKRKKAAP